MLIDFKLNTCSKYIHAQEVTITDRVSVLDTDLLSLKGKKLLTDLLENNFCVSVPQADLKVLNEIVEDLTNTVSKLNPVTYNKKPLKSALVNDEHFVSGTGFSSRFSTNVDDGIIQLTLAPANAGVGILGPSVEGVYPQASSEISVLFAVTSVGDRQIDVFDKYDITLKHGEEEVLKLTNNVWIGIKDSEYILKDSEVTKRTIQNATRESYLSSLISPNETNTEVWSLVATEKERGTNLVISISIPKAV